MEISSSQNSYQKLYKCTIYIKARKQYNQITRFHLENISNTAKNKNNKKDERTSKTEQI
jgi:hypothetical protein